MTTFGPFDPKLIEAEYTHDNADLPTDVEGVEVYAIGGGTVGEYYANSYWGFRVYLINGKRHSSTDLHSPSARNHKQAAELAAEFFTEEF